MNRLPPFFYRLTQVFGVLLALLIQVAGQTVSTTPAGFIRINIPGTGMPSGTTLSFKGLGLVRPAEFQGTATAISTNTITCSAAGWVDDQFDGANGAYYVEITGPDGTPGGGSTYDIAATTAATQTIRLVQDLASGVSATTSFRIRRHWTLGSVFGLHNEGGLQGGFPTTADTIQTYTDGVYHTYYYSMGGLAGIGWRLTTDGLTDQSGLLIYPEDALLITRRQPGAASLMLIGEVKTGQTSFPVVPGLNLLANPYAQPMTLASSGLYTGDAATGLAVGFSTTADQVLIFNGSTYDTYYYSAGGFGGTGWRRTDDNQTDQGSIPLPPCSSFLLRRAGGAGFNWIIPAQPLGL